MRVAHVADLHLTTTAGETGMTLAEQVDMAKWIGEDAYAAPSGAELLLFAGDLFEQLSSPDERLAAISVVTSWANRMPVVIVRGNHDRPRDLTYLAAIRSRYPIDVVDRPRVLIHKGASIACLPWPRKAELVERLGSVDALEVQNVAGEAMRAVLRGFEVDLAKAEGPRILLAHADLGTALLDNGQPVTGKCDIELGEADLLGVGADYVALGHIHKHQVIQGRLCYAGSPRPTKFPSETGTPEPHGYCLVDVQRGKEPVIEHRRTPYREMMTIEAEWAVITEMLTKNMIPPYEEPIPAGASVKLKYSVNDEHRRAAAEIANRTRRAWLDAGAHAVKIDATITPTYRVRSTAIQKAHSTSDRIRAYWEARGNAPAKPAQLRMITKLGELEEATL